MNSKTKKLVECGVFVALAFVLSLVKIPFPFGGSVTACCMVPLVIVSMRNGLPWGLGSAFLFSVIKLIMGADNFSYATGAASWIAILLFDYLLAYTLVGAAGLFKTGNTDSRVKFALKAGLGAFLGMFLRFACHVVSGAVVWYDLTKVWEEGNVGHIVFKYGKWMYSIVYNGGYMLPETIITVVATVIIALTLGKYLKKGMSK